jgi:hypothetical protein
VACTDPARVLVDYKVRIEPPKRRNGKRTLPLDDELPKVRKPGCGDLTSPTQ